MIGEEGGSVIEMIAKTIQMMMMMRRMRGENKELRWREGGEGGGKGCAWRRGEGGEDDEKMMMIS